MVKIRLFQTGKKRKRSWRIVIAEAQSKRQGKVLETIGHYDPKTNPPTVKLSQERLNYWLSHGAQLTEPVKKIIQK